MSKSCNLIGYAGIPATENKWLVGNEPGLLPAISRIEKAWLREASHSGAVAQCAYEKSGTIVDYVRSLSLKLFYDEKK